MVIKKLLTKKYSLKLWLFIFYNFLNLHVYKIWFDDQKQFFLHETNLKISLHIIEVIKQKLGKTCVAINYQIIFLIKLLKKNLNYIKQNLKK